MHKTLFFIRITDHLSDVAKKTTKWNQGSWLFSLRGGVYSDAWIFFFHAPYARAVSKEWGKSYISRHRESKKKPYHRMLPYGAHRRSCSWMNLVLEPMLLVDSIKVYRHYHRPISIRFLLFRTVQSRALKGRILIHITKERLYELVLYFHETNL